MTDADHVSEPNEPAPDDRTDDAPASFRYAAFDTSDGVVIYDERNHQAWIRSAAAVTVTNMV